MRNADYVEHIVFDLVVEEIWKWPAMLARVAVRPDMVTAMPAGNGADLFFHSRVKVFAEA